MKISGKTSSRDTIPLEMCLSRTTWRKCTIYRSRSFTLNPFLDRQRRDGAIYPSTKVGRRAHRCHSPQPHKTLFSFIRRYRIPENGRVYFHLSSERLRKSFDYHGFLAKEWLNGSGRVDAMLQQMAPTLNSNENFEIYDSFQISFTHVRSSPRGSGEKRKMKPGHSHPETFKRMKQTVVTIKNNDSLCCARVIVTAEVKVDGHLNWRSFKDGRKIQTHTAIELHAEANVPFVPSGCEELTKFALAPSLCDFQILLEMLRATTCDIVRTCEGKTSHSL